MTDKIQELIYEIFSSAFIMGCMICVIMLFAKGISR